MRTARILALTALLVAGVAGVAGCSVPSDDVYVDLQNVMQKHITDVDHRPVASVSCTPHVHDTARGDTAHLRCLVVFKDGSSYTADAKIQNQNTGGRHNMPDLYSWTSPPGN